MGEGLSEVSAVSLCDFTLSSRCVEPEFHGCSKIVIFMIFEIKIETFLGPRKNQNQSASMCFLEHLKINLTPSVTFCNSAFNQS